MASQDKINLVEETVIEGFQNGQSVDTICGAVFGMQFDGIQFAEIPALVRFIGKRDKFIIDQTEARKLATKHIEEGLEQEFDSWSEVVEWAAQITKDFNIDKDSWALNKIKGIAKASDIRLPEQVDATEWQLAAIEAYNEYGVDITLDQLADAIKGHVKNAKGYARLVYPIIKEIVG